MTVAVGGWDRYRYCTSCEVERICRGGVHVGLVLCGALTHEQFQMVVEGDLSSMSVLEQENQGLSWVG